MRKKLSAGKIIDTGVTYILLMAVAFIFLHESFTVKSLIANWKTETTSIRLVWNSWQTDLLMH